MCGGLGPRLGSVLCHVCLDPSQPGICWLLARACTWRRHVAWSGQDAPSSLLQPFEPVFLGLQSLGRGSAEGSVGLGPPQAGLQSAGAVLSSCAP